jgi:hypothetical protein
VTAQHVLDVREVRGVPLAVIDDARAFGERAPHVGVARHREVEDDRRVVEEAVLAEDADARARGDGHRAVGRRLVPRQDFQERRLARPVRAHEAVARARIELERHPFEQSATAVGLGELRDADHGCERALHSALAATPPAALLDRGIEASGAGRRQPRDAVSRTDS